MEVLKNPDPEMTEKAIDSLEYSASSGSITQRNCLAYYFVAPYQEGHYQLEASIRLLLNDPDSGIRSVIRNHVKREQRLYNLMRKFIDDE